MHALQGCNHIIANDPVGLQSGLFTLDVGSVAADVPGVGLRSGVGLAPVLGQGAGQTAGHDQGFSASAVVAQPRMAGRGENEGRHVSAMNTGAVNLSQCMFCGHSGGHNGRPGKGLSSCFTTSA